MRGQPYRVYQAGHCVAFRRHCQCHTHSQTERQLPDYSYYITTYTPHAQRQRERERESERKVGHVVMWHFDSIGGFSIVERALPLSCDSSRFSMRLQLAGSFTAYASAHLHSCHSLLVSRAVLLSKLFFGHLTNLIFISPANLSQLRAQLLQTFAQLEVEWGQVNFILSDLKLKTANLMLLLPLLLLLRRLLPRCGINLWQTLFTFHKHFCLFRRISFGHCS